MKKMSTKMFFALIYVNVYFCVANIVEVKYDSSNKKYDFIINEFIPISDYGNFNILGQLLESVENSLSNMGREVLSSWHVTHREDAGIYYSSVIS